MPLVYSVMAIVLGAMVAARYGCFYTLWSVCRTGAHMVSLSLSKTIHFWLIRVSERA